MTQTASHPDLQARYGAVAGLWQSTIDRLGYPAAYRHIFDTHPPGAPGTLLDVGCGSGAMAWACLTRAETRPETTLMDNAPEMLVEATRHMPFAKTLQAEPGQDLGARFDVILAGHVLEHLPDLASPLAWLKSHLAPGGRVYLAVSRPHWCTAILRWKWGHKAYRPSDMIAHLEAAGFHTIQTCAFPSGPPSRTSMGYVAQA